MSNTGALIPKDVPGFPVLAEGLWPERQLSVVAGSSGAGKTTWLYQLLAAWSKGQRAFGFEGPPGPYGLLAADRTAEAHMRTAASVGLPWDQIVLRSIVDDLNVNISELEHTPFPLLFKLLSSIRAQMKGKGVEGSALIVVDPLMVFLGIDLNKYHLVAARLLAVNRWCLETNTQLIATHHATKARSDWSFKRPQDRIAGSGAMLAFSSTQGFLAAHDELGPPEDNPDKQSELCLLSHHHPPLSLRLVRNDMGLFVAVPPKNTHEGWPVPQPHLPSPPAQALLDAMPQGQQVARKDVVLHCSSPAAADRHLDELLSKGLIQRMGHGVYMKPAPVVS